MHTLHQRGTAPVQSPILPISILFPFHFPFFRLGYRFAFASLLVPCRPTQTLGVVELAYMVGLACACASSCMPAHQVGDQGAKREKKNTPTTSLILHYHSLILRNPGLYTFMVLFGARRLISMAG